MVKGIEIKFKQKQIHVNQYFVALAYPAKFKKKKCVAKNIIEKKNGKLKNNISSVQNKSRNEQKETNLSI